MARSTFDLDVRGLLGAEEQLALLNLPPQLRRRLLNNVSKRVRSLSRQRIRNQQNLDGSPFEARKGSAKGKKKMEAGLGKLLEVTRVNADEAELGWRNALTRWVASQQHNAYPNAAPLPKCASGTRCLKAWPRPKSRPSACAVSVSRSVRRAKRRSRARPLRGLKSM